MKIEVEIEFKTLVSESKLVDLVNIYKEQLTAEIVQTNYYFDTNNKDIINGKNALRIRELNDKYTLTLKVKDTKQILEYNQDISQRDFQKYLINGFNPSLLIKGIELPDYVKNIAKSKTRRCTLDYKGGILFFDFNEFNNNKDFEIEFEYSDYDKGLEIFKDFLHNNDIEYNKAVPKIARAFNKI